MKIPAQTLVSGAKGEYEIERVIVSGAMGRLHLARARDGTPVIVKVPRRMGDGLDKVREERLRTEAKILREIWMGEDSDNERKLHILKYVDEGTYEQTFFFVSEFIEGGRLKETVGGRPTNLTTAAFYMKQILETLAYLHKRQVIHRDVNPKNLLIRQTNELVLIDFGLAHSPGESPVVGGTRPYAGAEQFKDPPRIQESSDIYGAGATFIFLLTGKEPHWLDERSVNKSELRNTMGMMPTELLEVIEISVQREPRDRFESAASMSTTLDKALSTVRTGYLIVKGKEFEIFGQTEIGRRHACDSYCRRRGFTTAPTIEVDDPGFFISSHHARIWFKDDQALLQDLGSINGTAVKATKDSSYELLGSRKSPQKEPFTLKGGEIIALAYDPNQGPHFTVTFRKKG